MVLTKIRLSDNRCEENDIFLDVLIKNLHSNKSFEFVFNQNQIGIEGFITDELSHFITC